MPITPRATQEKMLRYVIRDALEQEKMLIEKWDRITLHVKENCKHCLGRGWTGYNQIAKKYVICSCMEVKIIWEEEENG